MKAMDTRRFGAYNWERERERGGEGREDGREGGREGKGDFSDNTRNLFKIKFSDYNSFSSFIF